MYCTKCGKQIDYDAPICLECTAVLAIQAKHAREAAKAEAEVSAPIITPAPAVAEVTEQSVETADVNAVIDEPAVAEPKGECVEPEAEITDLNVEVAEPEIEIPEAAAQPIAQPIYTAPAENISPVVPIYRPNTRKEGLGGAIASVVLSAVSAFFVGIGLGLIWSDIIFIGVIFFLMAVSAAIVSIILGAKSIKTFKRVKNEGNPAPIATLILGIVGLASSAYAILVGFMYAIGGPDINILDYIYF